MGHRSRVGIDLVLSRVTITNIARSPLWLIRKQKLDRARKVMRRLYGPNNVDGRLAREIHIVRIENETVSLSPKIT
jgi:hypothetical protein